MMSLATMEAEIYDKMPYILVRRIAACHPMIKVTPIPTGKAWMKSAQKCGGEGRSPIQRKLDIFRDKTWAGPLDIFAWLIEHPEGRFIIDTGDSAENFTPGTCRGGIPFSREK